MSEFLRLAADTRYFGADPWYSTERLETYMMTVQRAYKRTNWKMRSVIQQVARRVQIALSAMKIRRQLQAPPMMDSWVVEGKQQQLTFVPSDLHKDTSRIVQQLTAKGFFSQTSCPMNPRYLRLSDRLHVSKLFANNEILRKTQGY